MKTQKQTAQRQKLSDAPTKTVSSTPSSPQPQASTESQEARSLQRGLGDGSLTSIPYYVRSQALLAVVETHEGWSLVFEGDVKLKGVRQETALAIANAFNG